MHVRKAHSIQPLPSSYLYFSHLPWILKCIAYLSHHKVVLDCLSIPCESRLHIISVCHLESLKLLLYSIPIPVTTVFICDTVTVIGYRVYSILVSYYILVIFFSINEILCNLILWI